MKAYLSILDAERSFNISLEHIFYISRWGIANSLSYALILAPLTTDDSDQIANQKMDLVARYIEAFVVRRSVNFRKFASSSIRYTMYTLVKEIRGKNLIELTSILTRKLGEMEESLSGVMSFRLHGQNRQFVKYLLSRMTSFIEQKAGLNSSFEKYFHNHDGKPFEIEHIWADKFKEHKDEFDQEWEFQESRNRIGDLILLPRGTNQSFSAKPYSEKLKHYIKENMLAQSLCELNYHNNPNFLNMKKQLGLEFKAHPEFKKRDIEDRQALYQSVCMQIWGSFES